MSISSNNKSVLMVELNEMKRKTREKRKAYWLSNKISQASIEGGYRDKGRIEIVDPGANTEAVFQHHQPDSHVRVHNQKRPHFILRFCLIEKKLDTSPS